MKFESNILKCDFLENEKGFWNEIKKTLAKLHKCSFLELKIKLVKNTQQTHNFEEQPILKQQNIIILSQVKKWCLVNIVKFFFEQQDVPNF